MKTGCIVFDAYGTLFDIAGAARLAAAEPGREQLAAVWPKLAESWRRKQVEYTWHRAITGAYDDFDQVTADALDWVLESLNLSDPSLRARLLALYDELPAFAEVPGVLSQAHKAGHRLAILSNGSPRMLDGATRAAGLSPWIERSLSVQAVRVFKPDAHVYALVQSTMGVAPQDTVFVSSNGWDIAGAARFGFRTIWVNRAGDPVDRLPQRPQHQITDLTGLPACL